MTRSSEKNIRRVQNKKKVSRKAFMEANVLLKIGGELSTGVLLILISSWTKTSKLYCGCAQSAAVEQRIACTLQRNITLLAFYCMPWILVLTWDFTKPCINLLRDSENKGSFNKGVQFFFWNVSVLTENKGVAFFSLLA